MIQKYFASSRQHIAEMDKQVSGIDKYLVFSPGKTFINAELPCQCEGGGT